MVGPGDGAVGPARQEASRIVPEVLPELAAIPTELRNVGWDSAITRGVVSLSQVTQSLFKLLHEAGSERQKGQQYWPLLYNAYQNTNGAITQRYFSPKYDAGTVLTEKGRLDIVTPPAAPGRVGLVGLLHECDSLTIKVRKLDEGKSRSTILEKIFGIAALLMEVNDDTRDAEKPDSEAMQICRTNLEEARGAYAAAAQTQSRLKYFFGVATGMATLVSVAVIVELILLAVFNNGQGVPSAVLVLVVVGALGAGISVMSRLSWGRLSLDVEAGTPQLIILGVVRPLIGASFAVVVAAIAASGIIALKVPSDKVAALCFYVVVAFFAGFSERWAQDMFVVAERSLLGTTKTRKPTSVSDA